MQRKQWVARKRKLRPIVRETFSADREAARVFATHVAQGIVPGPKIYGA